MSSAARDLRARNLRTLALLASLFLLPLLFAFLTYYGSSWRPAGHINHGSLISPARPLPRLVLPVLTASDVLNHAAPFGSQWTLTYLGDGACAADCRQALLVMRQTRLSLNNDMGRVARVFLVTGNCCARAFLTAQHPGLVVAEADSPAARALLAEFPVSAREHTLFIVDPLGNLMMSYDARSNPRGLLEDLKNLLRLSQIG
jgi:hypothetical protein